MFSLIWLEVGGLGPEKVAQQLMDSGMQIPGYRRSGRPIEANPQKVHSCRDGLRRYNHCASGWSCRFPRRIRFRHRYPAGRRHHLPVLRTADA